MYFSPFVSVKRSTCVQVIAIQSNVYSTYKQTLQSPYYSESGRANTPCNHTFIGIPSGPFVSFRVSYAYSTSSTWLYVTPGIRTNYLFYNRPIITQISSNRSATLQLPSVSDRIWLFTYEFRGRYAGELKESIILYYIACTLNVLVNPIYTNVKCIHIQGPF